MRYIIVFILYTIVAVCFELVGFGNMGIILLIWALGINFACYVEDIKGQNNNHKQEIKAVNDKLDELIQRLEE